jgi:cell division septation protein DedD
MPSEVNVPAAVIVAPAESSSMPQAAPVVNSPRITMRSSDGMRDPYEVQLASFKNRKNAETYRKAMLKKYSKWPVKVVAVGDVFKVRLPGFPDRETAEKTMKDSGIGNYLVVRVASGHR